MDKHSRDLLIKQIKQSYSIVDAVDKYIGLPSRINKRHFNIRCPFHDDKDPSLSVWADVGLWKCWAGCGGGDQIKLVSRLLDISYGSAVEVLAHELGISVELTEEDRQAMKEMEKQRRSDLLVIGTFQDMFDELFHDLIKLERKIDAIVASIKSIEDLERVGDVYHMRDHLAHVLDEMAIATDEATKMALYKQGKRFLANE